MTDPIKKSKCHAIDVHVGQRLRTIRKIRGLSQSQLAEILGVTFQQIQKYERATNRISIGSLTYMAGELGVDVHYFIEGIDGTSTDQSARSAKLSLIHCLPDERLDAILALVKSDPIMQAAETSLVKTAVGGP